MVPLEVVETFVHVCTEFISDGGFFFGFLLVLLESFLPILPLGVFVALNVNAFGPILGLFISWVATCLGCFISYLFFSYLSSNWLHKILSNRVLKKVEKAISKFQKISFSNLVLVNIVCGIARVGRKKFLFSIFIGKVFMLIFWGFVGKSFIDSMTDINTIIILSFMLIVAYVVSKVVAKSVNLD